LVKDNEHEHFQQLLSERDINGLGQYSFEQIQAEDVVLTLAEETEIKAN
jgi:hypothetical protein